jgi:ligand-binding sensor domain-containing protein
MLKIQPCLPTCQLLLAVALLFSCGGQSKSKVQEDNSTTTLAAPNDSQQIADYVVEIHEDKKGNLWFGTVGEGVARFDGKTLTYLNVDSGLVDNTVAAIAEDRQGNIWFGTHGGLAKYDGKTLTNYTTKDGLCNDRVSQLLIDKSGTVWVGTWGKVCRFDGIMFTEFELPKPAIELQPYQTTMNWVTEIMEDSKGNIWFGRDGYGACKWDGKTFTHYTKKDGLASNNVQVIREDKQGNIWFGCRVTENDHPDSDKRKGAGGLSRFDGKTFTQFPEIAGLSTNETYAIHVDEAGNVWIGTNKIGVYQYDGKGFTLYQETNRKDIVSIFGYGVQHLLKDSKGTLWIGLSGGLFRLDGEVIRNVAKGGPWE